MLAIGVPAKVAGPASRAVPRARQISLARRILDDLHETLVLRGSRVEPLTGAEGIAVDGAGRVLFLESFTGDGIEPAEGETVVLTLGLAGEAPAGLRRPRSARASRLTARPEACFATRCASSAASAASASRPARGATPVASSSPLASRSIRCVW